MSILKVEGLTMRLITNKTIINEIYVYEFTYRNSSSYNCYQKISGLDKDFSYEVKNKTSNYIAFHFDK